MKKVLSFLLLANLVAPAWCMDRAAGNGSADGGASSAASASTPLVFDIRTSDGKVVQLDHRFITACGFFKDLIASNHGSIPEDQRIWRDFPIQSKILQILLQLIDNPQHALPFVNHLSLMELNELHEAANLLVVAPEIQALIANRIVQELPHGLSTLNKADFNTFFHNTVIHLLSRNSAARSALALQLAQHGVRPAVLTTTPEQGIVDICFAPDGTLTFTTLTSHSLYLYDRTTQRATRIQDHVYEFLFAPDGSLAYMRSGGIDHHTLYLYDRATQKTTRVQDNVWQFSFAPDGTLAYTTEDEADYKTLYVYDRTTQRTTRVQNNVFNFSFAPDGTLAYITDKPDHQTLYVYDRATQRTTRIQGGVCQFSFAPDGTLAYIYITNEPDFLTLYVHDRATQKTTRVHGNIWRFSFAPGGTLAYITASWQLYLYNQTTGTSTPIRDHVHNYTFAHDGTLAIVNSLGQLQLLDFTHGLDTAQQLFMLYILVNERAGHPVTFTPQEIVALETRLYRTLDGTMPSDATVTNTPPIKMAHLMVLKSGTEKGLLLKKQIVRTMRALTPPPPPPTETWEEFIQSEYRLHHASLLDGLPEELRTHVRIDETGASAGAGGAGPA